MSGSSYSRSSFLGGAFDDEEILDCSNLNILSQVVSPTMSYFGTISVGEILDVKLDDEIVVLINTNEDTVGVINPPEIERLIKCLKEKYLFIAEILSIKGADIRVRISCSEN